MNSKYRRNIRAKRLGDYFRPNVDSPLYYYQQDSKLDFSIKNRHLYNRASFFILLYILLLAASLYVWQVLAFAVALGIFLFGLFLHTRATARGLFVERVCPSHAVERDEFEVLLVIRNASSFVIRDLQLLDNFTGLSQKQIFQWIHKDIGPKRIYRHTYKVKPSGGMGEHHFGPLEIIVGDPLGLFEFYITEHSNNSIEILPENLHLPPVSIPESLNSRSFGPIEGTKVGNSTNFYGVREYFPGDPIKQISWKHTARLQKPILKEMEISVATELTIILDLDGSRQIGLKERSTWEYSKDIVFALLRQQLETSRRIQLISQEAQIPFGMGYAHCTEIINQTRNLLPSDPEEERGRWLRRIDEFIPYGSTVLYVGPVFRGYVEELLQALNGYREMGVNLVCIFLDGASFLEDNLFPGIDNVIRESTKDTNENIQEVLRFAGRNEIPTYIVEHGKPIFESLRRPRVQ